MLLFRGRLIKIDLLLTDEIFTSHYSYHKGKTIPDHDLSLYIIKRFRRRRRRRHRRVKNREGGEGGGGRGG